MSGSGWSAIGMASFSNSAAERCAGAEGGGAGVSTGDCGAAPGAEAAAEAGGPAVPAEGGGAVVAAAGVFCGSFVCCAAPAMAKAKLEQTVSRIENFRFIGCGLSKLVTHGLSVAMPRAWHTYGAARLPV